jgi:hypothetical protein
MHPHRQVVLHHATENRPELRRRQRLAGDIGEQLDAAGAQRRDRAVDLGERRLDVVHRQRGDERRELVGMSAADICQRVVGEPRQIGRHVRRRHQLKRRIGERQDLLQAVEPADQRAARV